MTVPLDGKTVNAMPHQRAYVQDPPAADALLDPVFPYREELLQFIWEQRLFDPLNLCTVDGEPVDVRVRADLLVARDGLRYVAEVKTGGQAPDPTYPPTRRQLLEYMLVFEPDGLLLVNPDEGTITEAEYEKLFPRELTPIGRPELGVDVASDVDRGRGPGPHADDRHGRHRRWGRRQHMHRHHGRDRLGPWDGHLQLGSTVRDGFASGGDHESARIAVAHRQPQVLVGEPPNAS